MMNGNSNLVDNLLNTQQNLANDPGQNTINKSSAGLQMA